MKDSPKIVLIGNYTKDRQESMDRFCQMLFRGFRSKGIICIVWKPTCLFGRLYNNTTTGLGKWLGYIDKWLLYPIVLLASSRLSKKKTTYYHICDHSNAPYLKFLPTENTGITCHDVLAIRGAMGDKEAYCEASKTGKILQLWILKNLKKAKQLGAVSHQTLEQLKDITPADITHKNWRVIPAAFNAPFFQMTKEEANEILKKNEIALEERYIFHIGSDLPRKNRKLLVDLIKTIDKKWVGKVVFAGHPITNDVLSHAQSLGVEDKIISIVKPNHQVLLALYNNAEALIFPSFSEGFGWPAIEAQACGTPVIASNRSPMPEVSGEAAMYADPNQVEDFVEALLSLQNKNLKNQLVQSGFDNIKRFELDKMINQYLALYQIKVN